MASTKSILVIDDDEALNTALQVKFSDKGFTVTLARDGEEAIRFLEEKTFSVVLTDLHMPKTNGFEVLEHIKRTRNADTPCYVITNLGSDVHCERAMNLGARKCFIKSLFSLKDIVEFVDRAIA